MSKQVNIYNISSHGVYARLLDVDTHPKILCRDHLLSDHLMIHRLIQAGQPLSGTHNLIAREIVSRGYNHKSPAPDLEAWVEEPNDAISGHDINFHLGHILRCENCKRRYEKYIWDIRLKGAEADPDSDDIDGFSESKSRLIEYYKARYLNG
jgi:hypothetical protein